MWAWIVTALAWIVLAVVTLGSVAAEEPIGATDQVDPGAALRTVQRSIVLAAGDPVFANAVLATDPTGAVAVRFRDNTRLTMGPRSEVALDAYVYNPDATQRMAVRMGVGLLRMVSGRIDKERVRIETPVAVVGIRGTDFTLDTQTPGLTRIWLEDGAITVTPTGSGIPFDFTAPARADCTAQTCRVLAFVEPPRAFSLSRNGGPRRQGTRPQGNPGTDRNTPDGGGDGAGGGNGGGGNY